MPTNCESLAQVFSWQKSGDTLEEIFRRHLDCQSQMTTPPSLSSSQGLWLSDNDDYEDDIMENEVSQLAVLR